MMAAYVAGQVRESRLWLNIGTALFALNCIIMIGIRYGN
jgi:hypothetical protein